MGPNRKERRPLRLPRSRTHAFHACNTGSNPVGVIAHSGQGRESRSWLLSLYTASRTGMRYLPCTARRTGPVKVRWPGLRVLLQHVGTESIEQDRDEHIARDVGDRAAA